MVYLVRLSLLACLLQALDLSLSFVGMRGLLEATGDFVSWLPMFGLTLWSEKEKKLEQR